MSDKTNAVKPILPVTLGIGNVEYARGMQAGPWIFATGQLAQDYVAGMDKNVVRAHLPQAGRPKFEKEAQLIYSNFEEILNACGAKFSDVVRVDQYYRTYKAVDPYHLVRFQKFGKFIPPSTSMVMDDLLFPDADMDVQFIARVPENDAGVEHSRDDELDGPPTSGFPMGVTSGDFVFLSGYVPSPKPGKPAVNGIATEAAMPESALWKGQPILLETEYIVAEKIKPALEQMGSDLDHIVKAQVYLTHHDEVAGFNYAWSKFFKDAPPVTTIVPSPDPSIGVAPARVEINILALKKDGATKKEVIKTDVFPAYENQSVAIRAGDLLFVSGLMAIDENGLVDSARHNEKQPHFRSTAEEQANCIIENAARIAEAAGTSLDNVVRIQQFHTDIDEFYDVHRAWKNHLPTRPLPYSAIGIPGPLPVPGASVMMDLWFYAP